ncbi:hypothetical protein CRUP_021394 [Coryphaenoides rupestris]|nr:hypothetical protein CRUP_021394 [Coryphaenoides rupestris]
MLSRVSEETPAAAVAARRGGTTATQEVGQQLVRVRQLWQQLQAEEEEEENGLGPDPGPGPCPSTTPDPTPGPEPGPSWAIISTTLGMVIWLGLMVLKRLASGPSGSSLMWSSDLTGTGLQLQVGSMVTSSNSELRPGGKRLPRLPREVTRRQEVTTVTTVTTRVYQEAREIREAFKVFDRDGNGFISKQELGMAMRSLGYMPNEVELEVIIQRLDMDGDGQVDFEEFVSLLGPKLSAAGMPDKFYGADFDSVFWKLGEARGLEALEVGYWPCCGGN